ncbi:hypothetical protein OFB47_30400, partial [Escherichia coli]|nr:hypothetical protein [Escherichia coli]
MAAASAECQNYAKEGAGLRQLLLDSQSQLEEAKSEAQKQSNALALLKTQLERTEATLEDEQTRRQKLTAEFEEAQSTACR